MRKFGRSSLVSAVAAATLLLGVAAAPETRAADKSVVIYSANESVLDELVFATLSHAASSLPQSCASKVTLV